MPQRLWKATVGERTISLEQRSEYSVVVTTDRSGSNTCRRRTYIQTACHDLSNVDSLAHDVYAKWGSKATALSFLLAGGWAVLAFLLGNLYFAFFAFCFFFFTLHLINPPDHRVTLPTGNDYRIYVENLVGVIESAGATGEDGPAFGGLFEAFHDLPPRTEITHSELLELADVFGTEVTAQGVEVLSPSTLPESEPARSAADDVVQLAKDAGYALATSVLRRHTFVEGVIPDAARSRRWESVIDEAEKSVPARPADQQEQVRQAAQAIIDALGTLEGVDISWCLAKDGPDGISPLDQVVTVVDRAVDRIQSVLDSDREERLHRLRELSAYTGQWSARPNELTID